MKLRMSVVTLAVLLTSALCGATTVMRVPLKKLAATSNVIVHGLVTEVRVVAVNGNERHLRTHVTVQVRTVVKGRDASPVMHLDLPGGQLGKWAMRIPGMPGFHVGEEVVLFLEKTARNWALTGLGQGKFSVDTSPDGVKTVRRRLEGMHFVGYDARGRFRAVGAPPSRTGVRLDALLSEVRGYLKQTGQPPVRE